MMLKYLLFASFLVLLVGTTVNSQVAGPTPTVGGKDETVTPGSKEEAVLKREAERREAYTKLDPDLVAKLLADDYLTPTPEHPSGFSDKKAALEAVIKHRDAKDPYPIRAMRSDSTKVKIYGTIAVVTGISTIEMEFTDRNPPTMATARFLYMNVWHLEGKRWMLVRASRERIR